MATTKKKASTAVTKTTKRGITKKQARKQNAVFNLVHDAKKELIEQQRAELPSAIKKRKNKFIRELKKYSIIKEEETESGKVAVMGSKLVPMYDLQQMCFSPFVRWTGGATVEYTPDEVSAMFDYFRQCISEMNKLELVPPTKEMFCSICGISTDRFNRLKGQSPEMNEVLSQVEDYIANFLNMSGLTRKTDTVTGIFIQKSSLGRKEQADTPPQVTNNTLVVSDEEFADLLKKFS